MASKLKRWKERCLASAGKEVMIKAVATAIPVYTMGCFKLPQSICQDINKLMARFRGAKARRKKIHRVSWKDCVQANVLVEWGSET